MALGQFLAEGLWGGYSVSVRVCVCVCVCVCRQNCLGQYSIVIKDMAILYHSEIPDVYGYDLGAIQGK